MKVKMLRTIVALATVLAIGVISIPPAGAAIADGRLGGPPVTSGGSAANTLCPAGKAVTGVVGKTRNLSGFIPIVVVATVECSSGATAIGTMGSGDGDAGSTSCPSGQYAVGISGKEGDFVDRLQLRCRNWDGSGAITTTTGFGGSSGTADGPYDCPAGQVLTGLQAQMVFDASSIRYLEIVCGAGPDGRIGGPPVTSGGTASDTLCPTGEAVTGVVGKTRNLSGFIPIVVVATVECSSGTASGTMGGGDGNAGSTSCPGGQHAVGISGNEGDFVDRLQLRCRNADGSGAITTTTGFGGSSGSADGPYDCPVGQVLTGLQGQTVFGASSIRYVEIVCGLFSPPDGRIGGPPVSSGGTASDTLCPTGKAVTGVVGKTRNLSGFIPIVVVATVECSSGTASGTMGGGDGDAGSTSCPSGQHAVGIAGEEGDFVNLLELRCRNADGSGPITTSVGFGGSQGAADGPYDCPAGEVLTGLQGQTVFGASSIRYLEVVCGVFAPDTTAPASTATLSPTPNGAGWNNSDVTLELAGSDADSGVDSITYSATGAQSTVETVIPGDSVSLLVAQEGTTTFTYFATDEAGNAESPQLIEVKLDKAAPSLNMPADSTVIAPQGDNGMVIDYLVSASDALDATPSLSCSPASGTLFPIGVTTVNCSAADHADNASQDSFSVTVQTPAQATQSLAETVASYNLHSGTESSLTAKLRNATAALEEGRTADGCDLLGAFINEVRAQSGKKLTTGQATALQALADEVRTAADC